MSSFETLNVLLLPVNPFFKSCQGNTFRFFLMASSIIFLALLYPDFDLTQHFQVDHVFPKGFFKPSNLNIKTKKEDRKKFADRKDCVANLQFLSASENMKKSNMEPLKWLQKIYKNDENKIKEWKEKNYVDNLSLGIEAGH